MADSTSTPQDSGSRQPSMDDLLRRGQFQFHIPGMSHGSPQSKPENREESPPPNLDFHYTPKDIKRHLDRFIIGQDEAKKALSIAVCDHYNHVQFFRDGQGLHQYLKQNILLLGPTGVGKTYLIRCIAELIGVPFVKADATKFSETGYVGLDVDELVRSLVQQADGNIDAAECGIIYLDEVDKVAGSAHPGGGKDVSGRGVQTNLLKLLEETEVPLRSPNDLQGQMEAAMEMMQGGKKSARNINTRHILFIASGAFAGLPAIINRRLRSGSIGFQSAPPPEPDTGSEDEPLFHVSTQDLLDYGFEPEFAGRLPVRVACHQLTEDNLFRILNTSEGSILRQYEQSFSAYGIDLRWEEAALHRIASAGMKEETGARGLVSVLESLMREPKFELASLGPLELNINTEFMDDPSRVLAQWLKDAEKKAETRVPKSLLEFTAEFEKSHDLIISFTVEAAAWLRQQAENENTPLKVYCRERFKDFPYGLKLIAERTGEQTFEIDLDTAKDPDQTLSRRVVHFYRDAPE